MTNNQYKQYPLIVKLNLVLLFIIMLVFALVKARNFLYPIMISVLLGYLLYPLVHFLEKKGIPRIAANIFSILLSLGVFGGLIYFIASRLGILLADLPLFKLQALQKLDEVELYIYQKFNIEIQVQHDWIKSKVSDLFENSDELIRSVFKATTGTLAAVGFIPVYTFFFLFYRERFVKFMLQLTPKYKHQSLIKVLREISLVTQRYVGGIIIVVGILMVINTTGLYFIGMKYFLLVGIISAICNFVPYIGTYIGMAIAVAFTLLTEQSLGMIVSVVIFFFIVNFVENNILTPSITGDYVSLNPLFTIISLIAGALLWGLPGMFLVIPFIAMLKIVADNTTSMQPYAYILGAHKNNKHALTFQKLKSVFIKKK